MTTQVTGSKYIAGKVTVGPKVIGDSYYRIVAQRDRSGRIEIFDPRSRAWTPAPESVTFSEVWSAAAASPFAIDLACALSSEFEDDAVEIQGMTDDTLLDLEAVMA